MYLRRRDLCPAPLLLAGCSGSSTKTGSWPAEWDRILIQKAVTYNDQLYDDSVGMVTKLLGPTYQYHTRLRDRRAHPTRESLEYALWLLESGREERLSRAFRILERVISIQDVDAASKWYGIWGWYFEEPPSQMQPADWNWADFNGATLLLIELRHGTKLPADLRARVRTSIGHAAASIRRRNVSMGYTNIAVMGTFVTLAAAELLQDADLRGYAQDRVRRLCAEVDKSGSFSEYNSPTYAHVTLTNLTRIRMFVRDEEVRRSAGRLEHRVWLHLARHWDAPRMQFAGPMSRCYSTDLGFPVWLEKALGGKLGLASPERRTSARGEGSGETAIHDYRVPDDLQPAFLKPGAAPRQHREVFILPSGEGVRPVQGTTYVHPDFSLGSVNRGDFWNQRRPLLAYFGTSARPAQSLTMRLVKDSYDFSSALFYSVQANECVLGLVNFRNPGGDRHISLEPIDNGEFKCARLFLELDFEGLSTGFRHTFENNELLVDNGQFHLWFVVKAGGFAGTTPRARVVTSSQSLVLTVDLLPEGPVRTVRWAATPDAWLCFALAAAGSDRTSAALAESCRRASFSATHSPGRVQLAWESPAGLLSLAGSTKPDAVANQDGVFQERAGGQPVPLIRLSEEKLA